MTSGDKPQGDTIEWYLAREGTQYGPLSNAEMMKLVEFGHLKGPDLVWRAGFADWTQAQKAFPELAAAPAPAPAASAPASGAHGARSAAGDRSPRAEPKQTQRAEPPPPDFAALTSAEDASGATAGGRGDTTADERTTVRADDGSSSAPARNPAGGRPAPGKRPADRDAPPEEARRPSSGGQTDPAFKGVRGRDGGPGERVNGAAHEAPQRAPRRGWSPPSPDAYEPRRVEDTSAGERPVDIVWPAEAPDDHTTGAPRRGGYPQPSAHGGDADPRRRYGPHGDAPSPDGPFDAEAGDDPYAIPAPPPGYRPGEDARRPQPSGYPAGQWQDAPPPPGSYPGGHGQPAHLRPPAETRHPQSPQPHGPYPASPYPDAPRQRHPAQAPGHGYDPSYPGPQYGPGPGQYPHPQAPQRRPGPPRGGPGPHDPFAEIPDDPGAIMHEEHFDPPRRGLRWLLIAVLLLGLMGAGGYGIYASGRAGEVRALLSSQLGITLPDFGGRTATETVAAAPQAAAPRPATRPSPQPASQPAAAAPAASDFPTSPEGVDGLLQTSPVWQIVKADFPQWYAERVKEGARRATERQGRAAITRMFLESLVGLRRENARHAFASGLPQLRMVAAAFRDNLVNLSQNKGDSACYAFISMGEAAREIAPLYADPKYAPLLEAQSVAVMTAIRQGRQAPVAGGSPAKEDYAQLSNELRQMGWSDEDLQLFADADGLAKAQPARVCRMVTDWFSAHLRLKDPQVQARLLAESVRPVVGG